ncbi:MAG: hypothetical protein HY922_01090 [Elusimicrobia bacterium]|nr:hypothetical protein [Elusimicrobiota bacterium]
MSELHRTRVIAAIATTFLIGACLLSITFPLKNSEDVLYKAALSVQALVLLVYGAARASGAVRAERQERTWDLQRLTPLTSFEIAFGKGVGAPLFAYFLASLMLPWVIAGCVAGKGTISLDMLLWDQACLLALAFFTISTGLLISSHTVERLSKPIAEILGALLGFFAAYSFLPLCGSKDYKSDPLVAYFGQDWHGHAWITLGALLFGLWAFMGAKWRIGRDLLEGGRLWHIPAFMAFLLIYQSGLKDNFYLIAMAPAIFVYLAALLNSESPEQWRKWLLGGRFLSNYAPVLITASLSYVLFAAFTVEFGLAYGTRDVHGLWRYPLLQSCFLLRDCAFLQLCRFSRIRRPETTALIFVGLSYALPFLVLNSFEKTELFYAFMPSTEPSVGALVNFLPGLLQCAVMIGIFLLAIKKRFLKETARSR